MPMRFYRSPLQRATSSFHDMDTDTFHSLCIGAAVVAVLLLGYLSGRK